MLDQKSLALGARPGPDVWDRRVGEVLVDRDFSDLQSAFVAGDVQGGALTFASVLVQGSGDFQARNDQLRVGFADVEEPLGRLDHAPENREAT